MLLDKKAGTVAFERANTIRSVEYMRNMIADGPIHDRITAIYEQSAGFNESAEADEDRDILRHFHANGDEDADTEIKRILESTDDLTFDEMIGLESVGEDFYIEGANCDISKIKKEQIKPLEKKMSAAMHIADSGDTKKAIGMFKELISDFTKVSAELSSIETSDSKMSLSNIRKKNILQRVNNLKEGCKNAIKNIEKEKK